MLNWETTGKFIAFSGICLLWGVASWFAISLVLDRLDRLRRLRIGRERCICARYEIYCFGSPDPLCGAKYHNPIAYEQHPSGRRSGSYDLTDKQR